MITLIKWPILLFAFLSPTISMAIVDGNRVNDTDLLAKSTVALFSKSVKGKNEYCSAVVIEQDVLITAAHCLEDGDPDVLLGTRVQTKDSYEPTAKKVAIRNTYICEDYKKANDIQDKSRQDIAIIFLKEALPSKYSPVDLNLERKEVKGQIHVSGFGSQSAFGKKANMINKGAAAEDVELKEKKINVTAYDREILMMKQENGGLCSGDSGGGAYDPESISAGKPILEAVNVTAGNGKGTLCTTDSFALRISSKKEWILKTLERIHSLRATASVKKTDSTERVRVDN